MTHAKNSNTNLPSIDITRMHTQMRKSPREKESGERQKAKKGRIKENIKKGKKERKKEEERRNQ